MAAATQGPAHWVLRALFSSSKCLDSSSSRLARRSAGGGNYRPQRGSSKSLGFWWMFIPKIVSWAKPLDTIWVIRGIMVHIKTWSVEVLERHLWFPNSQILTHLRISDTGEMQPMLSWDLVRRPLETSFGHLSLTFPCQLILLRLTLW